MNRLDIDTRARVVSLLCEGMAVRPIVRATGVAKNTVQKLIRDLGLACQLLHDQRVKGLACGRVQADEVWAFIGARAKNVKPERVGEWGDIWLWSGIDTETKIVVAWNIGPRDSVMATDLVLDLASRISRRFELNTDGFRGYAVAVRAAEARGYLIDYARIIKEYATPSGKWNSQHNRYEQPRLVSVTKERVAGEPDTGTATTSHAERMNLTVRQHTKKMGRLTNAHAKKAEMLRWSLAIGYAYYNWVRPHASLEGGTPAMAQGLADRRWTVADLIALLPN